MTYERQEIPGELLDRACRDPALETVIDLLGVVYRDQQRFFRVPEALAATSGDPRWRRLVARGRGSEAR